MLRETENPTLSAEPKVGSGRTNRRTGDWAIERPSPMTRENTRKPRKMSVFRSRCPGEPALLAALVADGEFLTALGTTTREDFSPILSSHSLAKSMFVAPLSGMRLIRTLHEIWLLVPNKPRNITKNEAAYNHRVAGWSIPTIVHSSDRRHRPVTDGRSSF